MNGRQQYQLDALIGTQGFLDAHEEEVGPLKDTEGRQRLDAAVAQVNAHRHGQRNAENERRAAMASQNAQAEELKQKHMKPIAKFARAKLPGVPNFAALAESGSDLGRRELVTAARAMVTALEPLAEVLVSAQFPADVVQQLAHAADALENALDENAKSKLARGVATASLQQQLAEGFRAIALLDPIVTRKLAGNQGLLRGWRVAKRVVKKPGVVSGASEVAPEAPAPVVAPVVAPVSVVGPDAVVAGASGAALPVEKAA